jgi:hypothetical protein
MKVYKECCKNCLFSADAIVSPERRKEILKECKQKQTHFICHIATIEGKDICCRAFYDKLGHDSNLVRLARRLNIVQFVDQPKTDKLTSHKDINDELT